MSLTNVSKTSIVATLGPVSGSQEEITALVREGVSVFRLNFSHGTLDNHAAILANINKVRKTLPHCIAVMGDLCGPKIRTGAVEPGTVLAEDSEVTIAVGEQEGNPTTIYTPVEQVLSDVQFGQRILIDDGRIVLGVVDKTDSQITCKVLVGGPLSSRKGINLPDSQLSIPAITDYDWQCVDWAIEHGLDLLSLSFVQRADEIQSLKQYLAEHDSPIRVVAKIEKPQAVANIESIISASDAVMVARGDLGVEMDLAQMPLTQKRITQLGRRVAKPVIVATQVLQSMIENASPTRAEATDISNAVIDRCDAVMLSGETAVGRYPAEAVRALSHICRTTEKHLDETDNERPRMDVGPELAERESIARAVAMMLDEIKAKYVVVCSGTGNMARLLSKSRIDVPVVSLAADAVLANQLALYYGLLSVHYPAVETYQEWIQGVEKTILDNGWAAKGDKLLLIPPLEVLSENTNGALVLHTIA